MRELLSLAMRVKCDGRVVRLWRYPVKSMGAEALTEVDVSWHGFAGDRRWAFIRNSVTQSGFPWLTLRERADMNHFRPSFVEPGRPDKSSTVVRTPSGSTFDVADAALAAELCPSGARVIRQDCGIFDTCCLNLGVHEHITLNRHLRLAWHAAKRRQGQRWTWRIQQFTTC